jgi:hypothetical protein
MYKLENRVFVVIEFACEHDKRIVSQVEHGT